MNIPSKLDPAAARWRLNGTDELMVSLSLLSRGADPFVWESLG